MSFIWPLMLSSLILLPLVVLIYFRIQHKRRSVIANYAGLKPSQAPGKRGPGARRYIPPALFFIGLSILLVAMARPQTAVNVPVEEGTVLLTFDVSGSMAADDLKPTRMDAAKTAAQDFVLRQPASIRIGIIAFSDSGLTVQAPTHDQNTILATINRLKPERGTSLANGILASLNTVATASGSNADLSEPTEQLKAIFESTIIVLLTDGENTAPPSPWQAVQIASDLGVRIYTVGIGSPAGADLNIEGFTVHSRLDEPVLQQIAELSGGEYAKAENEEDLHAIYENIDPHWVIKPEYTEVTSLFASASLLILLVGGVISLLWFGRIP